MKTARKPYQAATSHSDGHDPYVSLPGRQFDGLGALWRGIHWTVSATEDIMDLER